MANKDIETKADIEHWVRLFYAELLTDAEMKLIFAHLDFEKHIPHIVQFWALVVLDEPGYTTNVFDKHVHLPIKDHHFDTWLNAFENVTKRLYTGAKADLAVQRAHVIAYTFRNKLNLKDR